MKKLFYLFFILLVVSLTGVISNLSAKNNKNHPSHDLEEPILPEGLSDKNENLEEPLLPEGIESEREKSIPQDHKEVKEFSLPFELTGFWETRVGSRTQKDSDEKLLSIGESRLQLEMTKQWDMISFKNTTDFVFDPVYRHYDIQLEKGEGYIDLRELNINFTLFSYVDVKMGRQILTWGTGDMVFLNDLFPKDWNSFFIGRDEEYLKAPSDSIKTSLFFELLNIDVVYSPRFDPDRYIDGRRISYWNTSLNKRAGKKNPVRVNLPNDWFNDHEIYIRAYKNISGTEMAFYFYHGFWKSPRGFDPFCKCFTFPKLESYGFSVRGDFLKGIGWFETAYYNSLNDKDGKDPFIINSQVRVLIGYEQEIGKDFTGSIQYYLEHMLKYHNYLKTLPLNSPKADKNRHLFTIRLTKLLMQQNLKLSMFGYISPSDGDIYLRPNIHYKLSDSWAWEIGANIFWGKEPYTFFGQFEKNTNIYTGIRYSFVVE